MFPKLLIPFFCVLFLQSGFGRILTGRKISIIKKYCTVTRWDKHVLTRCTLDVSVKGFPEFPWNEQNLLNDKDTFFTDQAFVGTCFKLESLLRDEREINFDKTNKVLKRREKKHGKIGKLSCYSFDMAIENSFQTSEKCIFLPIRGPTSCETDISSRTYVFKITYNYNDVTKESKNGENEFTGSNTNTNDERCDHFPDLGEKLRVKMDDENCKNYPALEKCGKNWNFNRWGYCTNKNFQNSNIDFIRTVKLDPNNTMDIFCSNKVPNFKTCIKPAGFCEKPQMSSFLYYNDLYSHYTSICDHREDFKVQYNCLENVPENQTNQLQIDFTRCFSQAIAFGKERCPTMQLWVLCRPLLLDAKFKGCASFDQLYQAEINTRDWTECAKNKAKVNPCKTKLDARFPKCNKGNTLEIMAFIPLSFYIAYLLAFPPN